MTALGVINDTYVAKNTNVLLLGTASVVHTTEERHSMEKDDKTTGEGS